METSCRSGKRANKRKFTGNRFTGWDNVAANHSASAKKLNAGLTEKSGDIFNGYRIVNISLFFKELKNFISCKACGGNVNLKEDNLCGLSSKFSLHCSSCTAQKVFRSSEMIGEKNNIPEINRRSVYAMRCIGQGLAGLRTFCGIMDLPAPVSQKSYQCILKHISVASTDVAQNSMKTAAKEEASLVGTSDISVSGDGTWKTRGHTSLTGACTLIGAETGKVIDIDVMSSYCRGCGEWTGPKTGDLYEEWKDSHQKDCTKNHEGSAGKMEVDGMCRIFQRSESDRGVRYVQYIGDGDTKTFLAVSKSNPYGSDTAIQKVECVGHVQKRMGTRLRKLKSALRSKKLADGKAIGGKGRLTDKEIDLITTYYGNAIRANKDSVLNMRKSIWAIFYHKRSTDSDPTHSFCPKGADSWCEYERAVANNTVASYKHQRSLPTAVMDAIKVVFKDLSAPNLIERCLGGKTQNPNESLNSTIWKYCPKTSGSGRRVVEVAANEAVIMFNEGYRGRLKVMQRLGLSTGEHVEKAAMRADKHRIFQAERRMTSSSLDARKSKRLKKAVENQNLEELEGVIYSAGEF